MFLNISIKANKDINKKIDINLNWKIVCINSIMQANFFVIKIDDYELNVQLFV